MARPTKYSTALADRICARIAAGESLIRICRDEDMPGRSTVMAWLLQDKEFSDKYARARDLQAEVLADEIIEIADDGMNDVVVGEDGKERTDHEAIARSKLRVDARKWYASKVAPKKYGDRLQQEITGKDGAPLPAAVSQVVIDPKRLEEIAKRLNDEV